MKVRELSYYYFFNFDLKKTIEYHWIAVGQQVLELIEESLVFDERGINVVQLGDANGGCFPHIGVLVLEALSQRLAQVLGDLVDADASHCAHGERPDERVWILAVLRKNWASQGFKSSHSSG